MDVVQYKLRLFQHTAARRRLSEKYGRMQIELLFQHTAARRRLDSSIGSQSGASGFNTQPPEGG